MDYRILPYSFKQAARLGVTIKPSKKKDKKIDVFKNSQLISSVGQRGYKDYPTYLKEQGKPFAEKRKKLYQARHASDLSKVGTPGYFANQLLW